MIDDLSIAIPLAVACVLISAFCSGTEVALFSLRRVDREQLAHSTSATDRMIVRLLERPRRLIATVLIGNQACTAVLAVLALGFACLHCEAVLAFFITLASTLLVVLISEVTAKTLAAKAPLAWARACTGMLVLFTFLITPIRIVIGGIAEILLRPLGEAARTRPARDLSEEEFRHLIDAGSSQGQIDARERRLIHRVFEFSDKNVGQVMTPRARIFALSYDLPAQRLVKELAARGFSRVPIYNKSIDNIRGVLNAKDLVRAAAGQPLGRPLVELLHEPLFVPRTTPVKRLFLTFKQKKVHMAVVVSEYGKVLGLVTMDDLLSQIFGVLRDERAALQASIPPTKLKRSGPGSSSDEAGTVRESTTEGGDTGPVPRESSAFDESRPVPREVVEETLGEGRRPATNPEVVEDSHRSIDRASIPALESDVQTAVLGPRPASRAAASDTVEEDEHTPPAVPAVDVDLIRKALGTPTDREVAGLPSRSSTIPPPLGSGKGSS